MTTRRRSSLTSTAHQPSLWENCAPETSPLPTSSGEEASGQPLRRRRRTPSFVCEVPLHVTASQERLVLARLQAARALYNACLGEALRRSHLVRQSHAYQHARSLPKKTPERTTAFAVARAAYRFSDADLQAYAKDCRHASHWIEDHLDAPACQKLATRAYRAVLRVAVGKARRVRFKGKHQLDTVEGKSNLSGLVWRGNRVEWKGLELRAHLPKLRTGQSLKQKDPVLAHGLAAPVKYVRLVRRKLGGKNRFSAQLICEGAAYWKPQHTLGEGTVGLDLGPSTLAMVSDHAAQLVTFCTELAVPSAQIRREQRHLDRQRRANNPDNYHRDGRVKKGRKGRKHWRQSMRQQRTQARLAERNRRLTAHRKGLQGRLAHQVVRQGSVFLLEQVSYKAWQRRYGRSIQRRAPGMFVQILSRLAESAGGQVHLIPTHTTKLSQTCQCGRVEKKPLSLRVHACSSCGIQLQRDLYSAYLIRFVDPDTHLLHADQARESWPRWESIGRTAWQQASPTSQPASGGAVGTSHVRRQRAARRQSRSSAAGSPANPKSRDVVTLRG